MVQALLGEWRAELARKPLSMTEADACQVLGVSPNEQGHVDEEALKAAYRCNEFQLCTRCCATMHRGVHLCWQVMRVSARQNSSS